MALVSDFAVVLAAAVGGLGLGLGVVLGAAILRYAGRPERATPPPTPLDGDPPRA